LSSGCLSKRTPRLLVLALLTLVTVAPAIAQAAGPFPSNATGFDISFPQCGSNLQQTGSFGIIGVTGGKAFTQNPCFAGEYDYAATTTGLVSIYMNLNAPVGRTARANTAGPVACASNDQTCQAHNYGWNAAVGAFALAGPRKASAWWLDIEIANSWAGKTAINVATIDGARDYLLAAGVANVGIYSVPSMWNQITGNWQDSTLPVWYAGTATTTCAQAVSFTSGPIWLVQNASAASNGDRSC